MVLEAGLLSGHHGDPTFLGEAITGGQSASDQMVLEAGLLSGPRGATTPPSGVPGNGKDSRPSLRHEVTNDAVPTTPG